MPITNYEHLAQSAKKWLFAKDISPANKKHLEKFFEAYDVSPARLAIFCKHIFFLLESSKDISKEMKDRGKINHLFNQLRGRFGLSYYGTIVNVSKRFVKWLNDGSLPDGFLDVKGPPRKEQRRKLERDDMITWAEGLRLAGAAGSVQWKAIIMTQLDGGFRPSEFVDLNYGDVKQDGDFITAEVKAGKTGARDVILYKSVPFLLRWLKEHPSKKKDDPLWVMENIAKSHPKHRLVTTIVRYPYDAIRQKVIKLGKKLDFKKPLDFYNLRHSACVLAKLDNIPLEEAAKKFGHSVYFFTDTYGRMNAKDAIERLKKHYGIQESKKVAELNRSCSRCGFVNLPGADICEQCAAPLTMKKALEQSKELEMLKQQMANITAKVYSLEAMKAERTRRRNEAKVKK